MSELIARLHEAGNTHKGTDLGGLLQWAALHIESQDEALADARQELEEEQAERIRLETSLHTAKTATEYALKTLQDAYIPPIDFDRDFSPHINLMAGHGDKDYLKSNGMSVRHVDLRTPKPRKKKSP
jgi:hypothetical protein